MILAVFHFSGSRSCFSDRLNKSNISCLNEFGEFFMWLYWILSGPVELFLFRFFITFSNSLKLIFVRFSVISCCLCTWLFASLLCLNSYGSTCSVLLSDFPNSLAMSRFVGFWIFGNMILWLLLVFSVLLLMFLILFHILFVGTICFFAYSQRSFHEFLFISAIASSVSFLILLISVFKNGFLVFINSLLSLLLCLIFSNTFAGSIFGLLRVQTKEEAEKRINENKKPFLEKQRSTESKKRLMRRSPK